MKIEAGKIYRTRDGRKVGPLDCNPESKGDRHPFVSSCGYWRYTADGGIFTDSTNRGDLIAEWVDEPTEDKPKWGPWELAGNELLMFEGDMQISSDADGTIVAYRIRKEPVRGDKTTYVDGVHLTFPTLDGQPILGTYTNEAGDKIVMEDIGDGG